MKRKIKMGLAVFMSLLMLVTVFPVNVFAEDAVCKIGNDTYTSIESAIAQASGEAIIEVLKNTSVSSSLTVDKKITLTSTEEVTVSCGYNTITVDGDGAELTVAGSLTLSSTGTTVSVKNGALTVAGGTVVGGNSTVSIVGAATVNVTGGMITTTASGSSYNVVAVDSENATINVSGGAIKGQLMRAIFVNKPNVTLNITGGTISARTQVVFFDKNGSGTINISGNSALIEADGDTATSDSGTWKASHAIYLNCIDNKVTVNMTGGTVRADHQSALYCNGHIVVNLDNGTIDAADNYAINIWRRSEITVNGGSISSKEKTLNYNKGAKGGFLTITGGELFSATKDTIFFSEISNNMPFNVSGGTIKAGTERAVYYGNVGTSITTNITGGTFIAANNTITAPGGFQTINIGNATVTATESIALNCDGPITSTVINILDGANITAGVNAMLIKMPLITVNVKGGYIRADGGCVAVVQRGTLNVTGGIFELNGTASDALVVHGVYDKNLDLSGTVNINGGLFINENMGNSAIFGADSNATPINYVSGKIMYADNITNIIAGGATATKTTEVIYDRNNNQTADAGENYFIYNKFAGAEKAYAGEMIAGASARLVENSSGLRFTTDYSADVVNALKAKGDVTYGTIIVPTEYLTSLDSFTLEALIAKYGADKILNVVCSANAGLVVNGDGSVTTQAAIVNIKEANYGVAFSAISYACVNGEYYYTAYDQGTNARTVKDVAAAALADTEATYTDAQKAILNAYVADTNA